MADFAEAIIERLEMRYGDPDLAFLLADRKRLIDTAALIERLDVKSRLLEGEIASLKAQIAAVETLLASADGSGRVLLRDVRAALTTTLLNTVTPFSQLEPSDEVNNDPKTTCPERHRHAPFVCLKCGYVGEPIREVSNQLCICGHWGAEHSRHGERPCRVDNEWNNSCACICEKFQERSKLKNA